MKKIAFFACALVVSMVMTSCSTIQSIANNQQVGTIVQTLLTNYVSAQGTTHSCAGTGTAALWTNKGTASSTNFTAGTTQTINVTIPVVITTASSTVQMTLPDLTLDGAAMSGVALGALTYSNNTITAGDNTTATGTLTVNGKSYSVAGAYLNGCTYASNKLTATQMQIFFGSNYEYVVNIAFTGTAAN